MEEPWLIDSPVVQFRFKVLDPIEYAMGNPRECRQLNAVPSSILFAGRTRTLIKEGFTFRTMGVANTVLTCPAVFWTVEEMNKRSGVRKLTSKRKRRF